MSFGLWFRRIFGLVFALTTVGCGAGLRGSFDKAGELLLSEAFLNFDGNLPQQYLFSIEPGKTSDLNLVFSAEVDTYIINPSSHLFELSFDPKDQLGQPVVGVSFTPIANPIIEVISQNGDIAQLLIRFTVQVSAAQNAAIGDYQLEMGVDYESLNVYSGHYQFLVWPNPLVQQSNEDQSIAILNFSNYSPAPLAQTGTSGSTFHKP